MKILLLIILLILIFALCYIMYSETKTFCEGLQNYDASFINFGINSSNTDVSYFYDRIMDKDDIDLSYVLDDPDYNSKFFVDNSGENGIYDISGIERDIKYFNNVSHILADYYSKNMIINEE